jgi:2-methylisocitrate lyase-like PEP mutase family enzyme
VLTDALILRTIAAEVALPLNAMILPGLPPVAELQKLGVRRVSAGSGVAHAAYSAARAAAREILEDGRYDRMYAESDDDLDLNELLTSEET